MATATNEIALALEEYIKAHPPKPFKVAPFYSLEGDFVDVLFANESHYGDPVTNDVVLFRSHDTNEIVGVQIHGIKRLVKKAEGNS